MIISLQLTCNFFEKSLYCSSKLVTEFKRPLLTPKSDILHLKLLKPFDLPIFATAVRFSLFFPPSNFHSKKKIVKWV